MHLFRSNLGDLVAASFPVPDNPILLGTAQATGMTGLADLVAAAFPLPQNPIIAPTSMDRPKILTPPITKNALMRSLTAAKTGPVSNGIGQVDASSILQSTGQFLDNTIEIQGNQVPYWVFAIGGAALLLYLMGGKTGQRRYERIHGGGGGSMPTKK